MKRTLALSLVVAPLLLSACARAPHLEPAELPIRPHPPGPEVPIRPHAPIPGAPEGAVRQRGINVEKMRLIGSHTKDTISMACKIDEASTAFTGEWEDRISVGASTLGVPNVELRTLVAALYRDKVSGDEILGAAKEQLCKAFSGGH